MLLKVVALCLISAVFGQLNQSQINLLLSTHNIQRALIASGKAVDKNGKALPAATNMNKMTWSTDIAAAAQAYANQCIWAHDQTNPLGENLASNTGNPQMDYMVMQWYHEIDQSPGVVNGDLNSYSNALSGLGHWTQLGWSSSVQLGCGFKVCPSMGNFLVCRYSPAGNLQGAKMYDQGTTGSKCNGNSVENGLCLAGATTEGNATTPSDGILAQAAGILAKYPTGTWSKNADGSWTYKYKTSGGGSGMAQFGIPTGRGAGK